MITRKIPSIPFLAVLVSTALSAGLLNGGQSSSGPTRQSQGRASISSPASLAIQQKIEGYLRNINAWDTSFKLTFGPLQRSSIPDLYSIQVDVSDTSGKKSATFHVSKDGRYLIRGDFEDMNSNPLDDVRKKIHIEGAPSKGPENAKVTLVVYEDFECPVCRQLETMLRSLLPNFPQVRIIHKDYPLTHKHPWAMTAALAGRCAYDQSPVNFWKLHDMIFDNQDFITPNNVSEKLEQYEAQAGLDAVSLQTCMSDPSVLGQIQASLKEGESLQVTSTPTIFINGRRVLGPDEPTIEHFIRYELEPPNGAHAP